MDFSSIFISFLHSIPSICYNTTGLQYSIPRELLYCLQDMKVLFMLLLLFLCDFIFDSTSQSLKLIVCTSSNKGRVKSSFPTFTNHKKKVNGRS